MAPAQSWTPYSSLTDAPTNLKEAIDWVLRVTGRDGKNNNKAAQPQSTDSPPHCLCYLAKAVKDLLYDAKDPGSPGPHPDRYWDDILLTEESTIVNPVLTDLGLLSVGSTSAARDTCAGGTEVIKALIEQLALGLQKWVGWQETGDDCCLKGESGIGKKCECPSPSGGAGCCGTGVGGSATTCHQCLTCGTGANGGQKCYLSAYCKTKSTSGGASQSDGDSYWPTISSDCTKVHLLARIFLGSVGLIWSGLSQLGFLTGNGSNPRWNQSSLHEIKEGATAGLGSFMAAMGYDLDRLNQGKGSEKTGQFVHGLLTSSVGWKDLCNGAGAKSVAEYYSSIYSNVKSKNITNTESLCKEYPLLVLHILASGYFRAGSAGAKGITSPAKPATSPTSATPSPRKPRTIREILYWLSALPYSQGYCGLVGRMKGKMESDTLKLEGDSVDNKTQLSKDCITHYLMAACGYCPLVLIGIQGTIATSGNDSAPATGSSNVVASTTTNKEKCPKKYDENKDCDSDKKLTKEGKVCYGGYHLEVSKFGPLHGMYANGLFGFQMDISPAQCLDQLRVYVYHCFYQLYFLRKQCSTAVEGGVGAGKTVLGWQSCRYGSGVNSGRGVSNGNLWMCKADGAGAAGNDCLCKKNASNESPLMYFLCDGLGLMVCEKTKGVGLNSQKQNYPEIDAHMNKSVDSKGIEQPAHKEYPQLCPVPMGWSMESKDGHFKDLKDTHKTLELDKGTKTYPAHCTGNTLALLLEYYCDPKQCPSGTLVVLLRLLACITPTVPRTLGDLFGFYYYIVYIGGKSGGGEGVNKALGKELGDVRLGMIGSGADVVKSIEGWKNGNCSGGTQNGTLKCLVDCTNGTGSQYLCPLSGQQYGQLSPLMAGTYLSWLVYLIGEFETGLKGLKEEFQDISCKEDGCTGVAGAGCNSGTCTSGTHGGKSVCCCESVVSCAGVLPVLYKYGFGYGNVTELHKDGGGSDTSKRCHNFLGTLNSVKDSTEFKKLTTSINQLIYTTRLPWIFVLTLAWLVAVFYLAFGAIWPLDWTYMRSHCRGWFRKGSLSPWEVLMVGKKKGRGILEFFGGR